MTIRYVHTNIVAEDWQRLVRFYQQVFDCVPLLPERNQSGDWLATGTGVPGASLRGVHLRLPGCGDGGPTLEIFQYGAIEPGPRPAANRRGYGHLAFRVDDVAAMRQRVLTHGGADLGRISETEVAGFGHLTFVYMTDPEGNILEIQSWS